MARALLASGAGKGTRIGLLAPDGALLLTTFYAALRIGALVTPISTLTTPPELAHILRTSDVQLLVGARRFLRRDFAANLEAALPGLAEAGTAPLRLPSRAPPPLGLARRRRRRRLGPPGRRAPGPRRRAGRAGRRAPRRGRAGGVAGRRRVRRLHLGQHCRTRRPSSTASGRSRPSRGHWPRSSS